MDTRYKTKFQPFFANMEAFYRRAPQNDAANAFCFDDISELWASGYLRAGVPVEFGGSGFNISELCYGQRWLAKYAPATALAVNMHQVWIASLAKLPGIAGNMLKDAAAGEIFAFGISEPNNSKVLYDSHTEAVPVSDGNYEITGRKIFTTLSPVWTRLGLHAKTPDGKLLFGFIRRDGYQQRLVTEASKGLKSGSISHPEEWNALGMRATHSYTTDLHSVPLLSEDIVARVEPGSTDGVLQRNIFACFILLTSSVYLGIASSALELSSSVLAGQSGADVSPARSKLWADSKLEYLAAANSLELLAAEIDSDNWREDTFMRLSAAKNQVCDMALNVIKNAMRLQGSRAYSADSELARLYRDVAAGMFHPTGFEALYDTVLKQLG